MALPHRNRLVSRKEVDYVFKNGRTVKGSFLFIKWVGNQAGYLRITFVVPSKHIPLAVDRNRAKRLLSGEIMRMPVFLGKSCDAVVAVFKKVARSELNDLPQELSKLISKI